MGESSPLEELAARKRLVRAKMHLHRAEISLQVHQMTEPLRVARSKISEISHHPMGRLMGMAGVGFLFFSRGMIRRTASLVLPVVFPQVRQYVASQAARLLFRGLNLIRSRS